MEKWAKVDAPHSVSFGNNPSVPRLAAAVFWGAGIRTHPYFAPGEKKINHTNQKTCLVFASHDFYLPKLFVVQNAFFLNHSIYKNILNNYFQNKQVKIFENQPRHRKQIYSDILSKKKKKSNTDQTKQEREFSFRIECVREHIW